MVHVNGRWFNVSEAMRRGRNIRCAGCKQRGATLGCFEPSCTKSYHVLCTSKPLKKLEEGLIFWCVTHEAKFNRVDDYEDVYSCDRCGCSLGIDNQLVLQRQGCVNRDRRRQERYSWFTCGGCASHFSSFDLCPGCFQEGPGDHSHPASLFVETNIQSMREAKLQESQKLLAFMKTRKAIASKLAFRKTQDSTKSDSRCTYCWTQIEAMSATKGGILTALQAIYSTFSDNF